MMIKAIWLAIGLSLGLNGFLFYRMMVDAIIIDRMLKAKDVLNDTLKLQLNLLNLLHKRVSELEKANENKEKGRESAWS